MLKHLTRLIATALAASLIHAGGAQAAGPGGSQPRAWVSALGADAAGCGAITTPCRTFQFAHDSVVAPGGTIYVKDSANYGQLVIAHALSIINNGSGTATILATSGNAIAINAGATDAVFIKGLILDGAVTGAVGINFLSGGGLVVENCVVRGFESGASGGVGIFLDPASTNATFTISDTIVTGNGFAGVYVVPFLPNGLATASINGALVRVEATKNTYGVRTENGFGTGSVVVLADQVNASENGVGFYTSQSILRLTRSIAAGNFLDGVQNQGTVYTYGDNAIDGNSVDVSNPMSTANPLR